MFLSPACRSGPRHQSAGRLLVGGVGCGETPIARAVCADGCRDAPARHGRLRRPSAPPRRIRRRRGRAGLARVRERRSQQQSLPQCCSEARLAAEPLSEHPSREQTEGGTVFATAFAAQLGRSPLLERGDERGEPRTGIVIEIECEAVFVDHARVARRPHQEALGGPVNAEQRMRLWTTARATASTAWARLRPQAIDIA